MTAVVISKILLMTPHHMVAVVFVTVALQGLEPAQIGHWFWPCWFGPLSCSFFFYTHTVCLAIHPDMFCLILFFVFIFSLCFFFLL